MIPFPYPQDTRRGDVSVLLRQHERADGSSHDGRADGVAERDADVGAERGANVGAERGADRGHVRRRAQEQR